MSGSGEDAVRAIVGELERAWNAADGTAFARPFADDADFVNIRGEHFRTREAIAKGHQGIFDTIYKGSRVRYETSALRSLSPGVLVAHIKSTLNARTGPLAGEHTALFTMIVVNEERDEDEDESRNWQIASFHNTLIA